MFATGSGPNVSAGLRTSSPVSGSGIIQAS
jgi:hypothetical protein